MILSRRKATLLVVRFEEMRWRPNVCLWRAIDHMGLAVVPLPPDPVMIGGKTFDPAKHFEAWRKLDERETTRSGEAARQALDEVLRATPEGKGGWAADG